MTDTLEAQVLELTAACMAHGSSGGVACVACIASWARRLVVESRAGALREAKRYMKHDRPCVNDATLAVVRQRAPLCTCGRDALAAEAEPGAQDRAGKGHTTPSTALTSAYLDDRPPRPGGDRAERRVLS